MKKKLFVRLISLITVLAMLSTMGLGVFAAEESEGEAAEEKADVVKTVNVGENGKVDVKVVINDSDPQDWYCVAPDGPGAPEPDPDLTYKEYTGKIDDETLKKIENVASEALLYDGDKLFTESVNPNWPEDGSEIIPDYFNYKHDCTNTVIWNVMDIGDLGEKPGHPYDDYQDALLKAAESGENYRGSVTAVVDGEEITWNRTEEKDGDRTVYETEDNVPKLIFSKNEDGTFASQAFDFEWFVIEGSSKADFQLPKGYSFVENEDGTCQIVSDSKPDAASLSLVNDFITATCKLYSTDAVVKNNVTGATERYQDIAVVIEKNDGIVIELGTDVTADITIEKVDEQGKPIQKSTKFYLWYEQQEVVDDQEVTSTYYIVQDGDTYTPVKYDKNVKDNEYTIDVTGSLDIDRYLLESMVYFLQEAVAPDGYDRDDTIQIICTEEQYKALKEELGETIEVTNVANGETKEVSEEHHIKLDGDKRVKITVENKKSKTDHNCKPDHPGKPDHPNKPGNPSNPGKPSNPTKPTKPVQKPEKPVANSNNKGTAPKTGDMTNENAWACLVIVAVMVLIPVCMLEEKKVKIQ